jgi:hypothetical protein
MFGAPVVSCARPMYWLDKARIDESISAIRFESLNQSRLYGGYENGAQSHLAGSSRELAQFLWPMSVHVVTNTGFVMSMSSLGVPVAI